MAGIHKYDCQDLLLSVGCQGSSNCSEFDKVLVNLWEDAMNKGCFRYKLMKNTLPSKVLPGKFSYIAQLNPDRAEKRRKPQEIQSLSQPFNPNEFNFNKVRPEEVLIRLEPHWSTPSAPEHLLLINVSPLEFCHVLLTPCRNLDRPQRVTREGLRLAVELVLLSHSIDFRVGFNSLCGYATVNHEHWHAYYLSQSHRLYVETAPLKPVGIVKGKSECFEFEDAQYPPGFCFLLQDVGEMDQVIDGVMTLVEHMQDNQVAHNLFITRGGSPSVLKEDSGENNSNSLYNCIRLFIWARKSSFGAKECDAFNPALCELAGHFPIKNETAFRTVTEEFILKELHSICDEPFQIVKDWIIKT